MSADNSYAKQIPSALSQLLNRMYRVACIEHNRLMSREEVKLHGIKIDTSMVERYQQKRRYNEVNQEIRDLTAQTQHIGKRFTSKTTLAKTTREQNDDEEKPKSQCRAATGNSLTISMIGPSRPSIKRLGGGSDWSSLQFRIAG